MTGWPYVPVLERLGLALSLGLFIGIERERRHKEAGLRTFGFTCLIGAIGGLLGDSYALLVLFLLGILITFLNLQTLRTGEGAELTTSAAMILTALAGILAGQGHTVTPCSIIVIVTALLTWKEPLSGFSLGISEPELRSAVVLAILGFVVYPALPAGAVGPWRLIEPRAVLITVMLIAGLGFVNYILWKIYAEKGMELTGFLGGLVNSTVTVSELAARDRESGGAMGDAVYVGIVLATAAMVLRNAVLLGLLAPRALERTLAAYVAMLAAIVVSIGWSRRHHLLQEGQEAPALKLESPFSLLSALRYGIIFLALEIVSSLAQQWLGHIGTYITAFFGGMVSSASEVAAAGSLAARQTISPAIAGEAAVIASLTSAVINFPFVARSSNRRLVRRLALTLGSVIVAGILGASLQSQWMRHWPK